MVGKRTARKDVSCAVIKPQKKKRYIMNDVQNFFTTISVIFSYVEKN